MLLHINNKMFAYGDIYIIKNTFFINCDISDSIIRKLIKFINIYLIIDQKMKDLNLLIRSSNGSVKAAFKFVHYIRKLYLLDIKIQTTICDKCSLSGFIIAMCGFKRFMTKDSIICLYEDDDSDFVSYNDILIFFRMIGKINNIEYENIMKNFLSRRVKIDKKTSYIFIDAII